MKDVGVILNSLSFTGVEKLLHSHGGPDLCRVPCPANTKAECAHVHQDADLCPLGGLWHHPYRTLGGDYGGLGECDGQGEYTILSFEYINT